MKKKCNYIKYEVERVSKNILYKINSMLREEDIIDFEESNARCVDFIVTEA